MAKLMENPASHALLLGLFALAAAALLASGDLLTRTEIEKREAEDLQQALAMVVPARLYDNDPLKDTLALKVNGAPRLVYRAMKKGEVQAVAFQHTVRGYAGITYIMGIDRKGEVLGVRVLKHEETPGLGDQIEEKKSDWIRGFDGRSLANTPARGWNVKKDGGEFDQFSGATITPRALVKAVHRGLRFFEKRKAELLAPPARAQQAPGNDRGGAGA